jgi:RNA polymerase sigma-70 factor (sigma-E family)
MTFEEYARARLPQLLRVAQTICGDRQLGEDLVQNVLIKLHLRWSSVAKLDAPDAYVRRMLVNEFLSWRRKWARLVLQAEAGVAASDGRDPLGAVAERDALVREIGRLPDRQRIAITLRYLADLPDDEIAAALGCAPSTVRVHISRALATLRISGLRDAHCIEGGLA